MLFCTVIFCGCGDDSEKTVSLYLIDADGACVECTIRTNASDFAELLEEKKAELLVEYEISTYGMYITSICGWEMPESSYVEILVSFHSVEGNIMTFTDPESGYNSHYVCLNGAECDSAIVGASFLPVVDGETYVLKITTYSF